MQLRRFDILALTNLTLWVRDALERVQDVAFQAHPEMAVVASDGCPTDRPAGEAD